MAVNYQLELERELQKNEGKTNSKMRSTMLSKK